MDGPVRSKKKSVGKEVGAKERKATRNAGSTQTPDSSAGTKEDDREGQKKDCHRGRRERKREEKGSRHPKIRQKKDWRSSPEVITAGSRIAPGSGGKIPVPFFYPHTPALLISSRSLPSLPPSLVLFVHSTNKQVPASTRLCRLSLFLLVLYLHTHL